MKKIVILLMLFWSGLTLGQSKLKNMTFIPAGEIILQDENSADSREVKVSLRSFFISNEITNKEFRTFVDYLKAHPDGNLEWVDLKSKPFEELRKDLKSYIVSCKMADVLSNLIDTFAMANEYPINSEEYTLYQNYFTDKKYDDYPVVGVTRQGAMYYCIWRTTIENNELMKKGKPTQMSYRLATLPEWYCAQQYCPGPSVKSSKVDNVKSQKVKKMEVPNMNGNVSEWISSSNENGENIAMGNSWKSGDDKLLKTFKDKNVREGYIGFRIVKDSIYE
ncbi:SUMF1/EgtB/PvdO family nonheme iron enzyme [Carboxylicivirga caseinilyticus]|uniref:SUMF1/EgtB/PvdO family nonheme iron enzyme n=1 Tax=Carboxylicivirga caseinilyticus TaxID=3417572 RepID=UPI003D34DFDA|nr:SUMF1/EgtB/PvdO family nonheme iron enzyme [Marinilabiliaceae bacterium A049]